MTGIIAGSATIQRGHSFCHDAGHDNTARSAPCFDYISTEMRGLAGRAWYETGSDGITYAFDMISIIMSKRVM